ncbi:MAG TPA: hypothetical protein PKL61_17040 [Accumulibacter sp.]|uniref:hypothetical protein n=1 Tax=Accumulibacter sp. TaxID=2053492 RepID=UPI002C4CEB2F|nr:hypothetical protein [Accumulibacter sp.]HNG17445.1 hypothetical protein [Accumulibacter sp.]HNJ52008.1 hypothetical protein [Accumulibacter sp.]HNL98842.1 hypothetical protein [Accumulibacter sp.]HNN85201.1 hypothetical protein [Accumulibacter sp.]
MNREISRPAATRRPPQWPLPGASAWGEDRYGLWPAADQPPTAHTRCGALNDEKD